MPVELSRDEKVLIVSLCEERASRIKRDIVLMENHDDVTDYELEIIERSFQKEINRLSDLCRKVYKK